MHSHDHTIALATVGQVLAKFAGAVIGLTAMIYILGFLTSTAYFEAFHARWTIDLLSAPQIMHRGAFVSLVFSLCVAMSTGMLFSARNGSRIIGLLTYAVAAPALVLASVLINISILSVPIGTGFNLAASILCAIASAFAASETVAQLSIAPSSKGRLVVAILILILGLCDASILQGQGQASRDQESAMARLAPVTLKEPEGQHWRLLVPMNDRAALVRIEHSTGYEFRVVDFSQIVVLGPAMRD